MRIIAGEFGSRVLQTPRGMETRPTSDRLRETLFNVLQTRMEGARFLDLYAGSGANGLEALSRGAAEAVLVEKAAPALAAIRGNVATLGLAARARVEGVPVRRWLGNAVRSSPAPFHFIFLDPPYAEAEEYTATLQLLGGDGRKLLEAGGVVVVEHRRAKPKAHASSGTRLLSGEKGLLAKEYGSLRQKRVLEQGDAALSFYGD